MEEYTWLGGGHAYGDVPLLDGAVAASAEREYYYQPQQHILPKSIYDLPKCFQSVFSSDFRYFNSIQSDCFDDLFHASYNVIISAPTGGGKTVALELAILHMLTPYIQVHGEFLYEPGCMKAVYIAPTRALVQEKCREWTRRFRSLGLSVVELTGDRQQGDGTSMLDMQGPVDIICTTPEKFDAVTRKHRGHGGMGFLNEIQLLLLDEVHLVGELSRGPCLEAGVVSRLKLAQIWWRQQQQTIDAATASLHAHHAIQEQKKKKKIRFVACSATIPNIQDLAAWLEVPRHGVKVFGDETRPVPLDILVKGYLNNKKNDYLFDRKLASYVAPVINEYSQGKPVLIFCSSRQGALLQASVLAEEVKNGTIRGFEGQMHDEIQSHKFCIKNSTLKESLVWGIGIHHAGLEPGDRSAVEQLFHGRMIRIVCTTSTLAVGVNLPAYLVIVKGTKRYAGPGLGYQMYDRSACLQMVGRAGRPQYDTCGRAVIMTDLETVARFSNITSESEVVESQLHNSLKEYLNAEIVLQTVCDLPGAIDWLRSTLFFIRIQRNPAYYDFPSNAVTPESLETAIRSHFLTSNIKSLLLGGMIKSDEDGYSLQPLQAGIIMAEHYMRLETMRAIIRCKTHPSIEDLLWMIASSKDLESIMIRRGEKQFLKNLNQSSSIKYHVMDKKNSSRIAKKITLPEEKSFLLIMASLSSKRQELKIDYSMRQEMDQILSVGGRMLGTMVRYFLHTGEAEELINSLKLRKYLDKKAWDDEPLLSLQQVPSLGPVTAKRLVEAGVSKLEQLLQMNPRTLESAAGRPFPFGTQLQDALKRIVPPKFSLGFDVTSFRNGKPSTLRVSVQTSHITEELKKTGNHCHVIVHAKPENIVLAHRRLAYDVIPSQLNIMCSISELENSVSGVHAIIIDEKYVGVDVPPTNASLFAPTTSKEFDLTGLDPETPAELKRLKSKSAGKQVVKDIDIIVIDDVDDDAYDEKAQHRMRPDDVQNERDNPEQPKNFCNMEDFLALF